MSPLAVSYWLLPGPEAEAVLEQLSALACEGIRETGGVCRLPPHVTLYSDHLKDDDPDSQEQAIDRLHQLADRRRPVQLCPKAFEASALLTQSLVMRFNAEARVELLPWLTQLCTSSRVELGYRLDPHLSLLYSEAPLEQRQKLAKQIPLPEDPLLFERVSAVIHPSTITYLADIAACTTIYECELSSPR